MYIIHDFSLEKYADYSDFDVLIADHIPPDLQDVIDIPKIIELDHPNRR